MSVASAVVAAKKVYVPVGAAAALEISLAVAVAHLLVIFQMVQPRQGIPVSQEGIVTP
jgi:hypothetical protein